MRNYANETKDMAGKTAELSGWVNGRRDHGKIIFIDLRDRSGLVQVVFTPHNPDIYHIAETLRSEWVVRIKGLVSERPASMQNKEIETGLVEIQPESLEILAEAQTPPFSLDTDGYEIGEENRMRYRYLDLRRRRMAKNLEVRHKTIKLIRDFLDKRGFWEVETPILTKSTPEGARDYVVPSRLYRGKFYALPQSPQQYKQLLMTAGVEKYFQIARCFRDEDTRGDRQPEFSQLDLEMSFVEREDVMAINEELLIEIVKKNAPQKEIQSIPFPRISYKTAMEKYGTDRPDLREDKNDPNLLAFCWVTDFPFFERDENSRTGWTFTHNPFSRPKEEFVEKVRSLGLPINEMDRLRNNKIVPTILTSQYDIVVNGSEIGGGSIRNHEHRDLLAVFKVLGYSGDEVEDKFSAMLHALQYGAPPHGGIAWGLDRLISILAGEPNIREVMAFPKTGDARDLMMDSPSELDKKQLLELGIEINKKDG